MKQVTKTKEPAAPAPTPALSGMVPTTITAEIPPKADVTKVMIFTQSETGRMSLKYGDIGGKGELVTLIENSSPVAVMTTAVNKLRFLSSRGKLP